MLNRSQLNFAHVMTVTLSWRVQNFVVIGKVHFKKAHFKFWSNFEFDRNTISGTGARGLYLHVVTNPSANGSAALRWKLHSHYSSGLTVSTCFRNTDFRKVAGNNLNNILLNVIKMFSAYTFVGSQWCIIIDFDGVCKILRPCRPEEPQKY